MYCYYKCSVALPRGAVCWSAVIVVFPYHTHLLFMYESSKGSSEPEPLLPNKFNGYQKFVLVCLI